MTAPQTSDDGEPDTNEFPPARASQRPLLGFWLANKSAVSEESSVDWRVVRGYGRCVG